MDIYVVVLDSISLVENNSHGHWIDHVVYRNLDSAIKYVESMGFVERGRNIDDTTCWISKPKLDSDNFSTSIFIQKCTLCD